MKPCLVIKSPLSLSPGSIVGLTEAQASTRRASLVEVGEGIYRVLSPIQFKAGETVGLDEATAKALRAFVDDGDGAASPAAVTVEVKAAGGKKLAAELKAANDAIAALRAENATLRADLEALTSPSVPSSPGAAAAGSGDDAVGDGVDLPPAT